MKISPNLTEIQKMAASGQYKVVPVSTEILSDICTPIEAMKILKNVSTHCYMLESAVANEKWGRYTFLGFDPKLEITCAGGKMKVGDVRFLETARKQRRWRGIIPWRRMRQRFRLS